MDIKLFTDKRILREHPLTLDFCPKMLANETWKMKNLNLITLSFLRRIIDKTTNKILMG